MKLLINTIQNIKKILCSLEIIMLEERHNLLNYDFDVNTVTFIEKKKILFEKYFLLSKDRISLEKKYEIYAPYKNNHELSHYWKKILKKSMLLKQLNLKNQVLINKKLHLNQYFLELFALHQSSITYNITGNLNN